MDKLTALERRINTLESRVQDLTERVSAYQSGTDKNPNTGVFVSDSKSGGVGVMDYDSANNSVRVTKVR